MTFLHGEVLWLLGAVLVLWVYLSFMAERKKSAVFAPHIWEQLVRKSSALGLQGRLALFNSAMVLMIIALAQPVIEQGKITIDEESIDVIVALDISRSMKATDLYPDRLAWAKKKIGTLIEKSEGMRVGVMAFAQQSFVVSALTSDADVAAYLLEHLDADAITQNGTDIDQLVDAAIAQLVNRPHKYLLLVTDGGDESSYEEAIAKAKEANLHIFVLATATSEGAPIAVEEGKYLQHNGTIVLSHLNEAIKSVALETGGSYIVSQRGDEDIETMLAHIGAKATKSAIDKRDITQYLQLFVYFLIGSVVLLLYAFSSLPPKGWWKRMTSMGAVALVLLFLPQESHAAWDDFRTIAKAKEAYEKGDYNQSTPLYEKLARENPTPERSYNWANSLYKEGNYEEAIKRYEAIDTNATTPTFAHQTLHNMGNSYANLQRYNEAVDAYEKALQFYEDNATKENLEAVRQALQEQKEQEQQEGDDKSQESQKPQDNQEQKSKQEQKGEKGEEKEGKNEEKSSDSQVSQEAQAAKKPYEQPKKEEMQESMNEEQTPPTQKPTSTLSQEEITDKEEAKVMRMLDSTHGTTYPFVIDQPHKKEQYAKPW
ncbi:MAG: hypothetical protein KU37_05200 [Sulfuricurvum sp. PC08-66]|nr:MAG: hypothetical protein KU37_05200 [Sulfuricurvum sp. PC08-66]